MIAVGRRWLMSDEVPLGLHPGILEAEWARQEAMQMEILGREVWEKLKEGGHFLVNVHPIREEYNGPRKEGSRVVDISKVQVEYGV